MPKKEEGKNQIKHQQSILAIEADHAYQETLQIVEQHPLWSPPQLEGSALHKYPKKLFTNLNKQMTNQYLKGKAYIHTYIPRVKPGKEKF